MFYSIKSQDVCELPPVTKHDMPEPWSSTRSGLSSVTHQAVPDTAHRMLKAELWSQLLSSLQ